MTWSDAMPILTSEMVELAHLKITPGEVAEFEELFSIERVYGIQSSQTHTLSVSLFFKLDYEKDLDTPAVTEDLLKHPDRYGLNPRYNPWNHYVEPILQFAPVIRRDFPHVRIRVYLAADLAFLAEAISENCEVYLMKGSSIRSAPGMLWRFLACEDSCECTILDADLMEDAASRIRMTDQLATLELGAWKIPVAADFSKRWGLFYRPIAGYASGYRGPLPMKGLLLAFWWCLRHKLIQGVGKSPVTGKPFQMFGRKWPEYGVDEFFLSCAVYPLVARNGVLSVVPLIPRVPRSLFLLLDAEYATWANPRSSLDFNLFPRLGSHRGNVKPDGLMPSGSQLQVLQLIA